MRVMCINDEWFLYYEKTPTPWPNPKFGEVVTVISSEVIENIHIYFLAEYPNPYAADGFAPLSEIDETTLVNKKEFV